MFCQETTGEAQEVLKLLEKYAQVFRQIIDMDKSSMTFCPRTPHVTRSTIQGLLGFQVVEKFEKYLGMPAVVGLSFGAIIGCLLPRWGVSSLGVHPSPFSMIKSQT